VSGAVHRSEIAHSVLGQKFPRRGGCVRLTPESATVTKRCRQTTAQVRFRSLAAATSAICGVTLTEDIQLSDFKRKWNFIFQMLPDTSAVVAESGHFVPEEQPEALANALRSFL
jgi:hypothetical protein